MKKRAPDDISGPPPASISLPPQAAFHFGFQARFQAARRQLKDQFSHLLDQFTDKFFTTAFWRVQPEAASGCTPVPERALGER